MSQAIDVCAPAAKLVCAVLGLFLLAGPYDLAAAQITAGKVTFENSCAYDLTLYSTGPSLGHLGPTDTLAVDVAAFNQGGQNVVMPYPNQTAAQCPNCDDWTALGGAPGTVQREGWMWLGDNVPYATSCSPNLSGRGICALQKNCCGPGMVQDGTFGTHWEFTPKGTATNDFVNLSTNFGTGPHTPPALCGSPGANPANCVAKAANIFFNVPVSWSSNQDCSFTTAGKQVTGGVCKTADCADAYQYPEDDKQASCLVDPARGYLVEFCP
jgi:hypothetical protein